MSPYNAANDGEIQIGRIYKFSDVRSGIYQVNKDDLIYIKEWFKFSDVVQHFKVVIIKPNIKGGYNYRNDIIEFTMLWQYKHNLYKLSPKDELIFKLQIDGKC